MIVRCSVWTILATVWLFVTTISGVVIFGWKCTVWTTNTTYSRVSSIRTRLQKKTVDFNLIFRPRKLRQPIRFYIPSYHRLRSGTLMNMTIRLGYRSWSDRSTMPVLMGECLKLHSCRFWWIHFFAETKQMECSIWTNFIVNSYSTPHKVKIGLEQNIII